MGFGKDTSNINGETKGRSRRRKPMGFGKQANSAEKAPLMKKSGAEWPAEKKEQEKQTWQGEEVMPRQGEKKAEPVSGDAAKKAEKKATVSAAKQNMELVETSLEPKAVIIAEEAEVDLTAAAKAQIEAARAKEELARAEEHAAKLKEEAAKAEERAAKLREEAEKADREARGVDEKKVEESKVDEAKVEEPKIEEPKIEEAKAGEVPKVEETNAEEVKVEETEAEDSKIEETKEEPKAEKTEPEAQKAEKSKSEVSDSSDAESQDAENLLDLEAPGEEKVHKERNMKKIAAMTGAVVLGLCVAGGGAYAFMGQKYHQVYFPNTTINGIDASGLTVDQVKAHIAEGMNGYTLVLNERDGAQEQIGGAEIGLHSEYDGTLEQMIAAQQPLSWGAHLNAPVEYTIETMVSYDKEKLQSVVDGLECVTAANQKDPKDAYVSNYTPGAGYVIVPEEPGTAVDEQLLFQSISDAILNLKPELALADADVYKKAKITSEDETLKAEADRWNHYGQLAVTYKFGDETDVLNGDTIHTWLTVGEDGGPVLDEAKVKEFVTEFAKKHNTAYTQRTLHTSYGSDVTIKGGAYGWKINQKDETAALLEILQSGESQEREPVYSQTAASHGAKDYGDTYVEINLTAQHLYYYKEGKLIIESDFVSGNVSKGHTTPAGSFPLTYKQRDATLKGQGYSSPVSYWMPFNGGIGMHDATWRSKFGGNIYKTSGSHGCINLPKSVAKTIFENITQGTPVLCYNMDGTGSSTTSSASTSTSKPATKATQAAQPAATAPAATAPAQPAPAETTAAAPTPTQNAAGPGGSAVVTPGTSAATGPGAASTTQAAQPTPEPTTAAPAQTAAPTPETQAAASPTPSGNSGQTQSTPGGSTGSQTQSTPGGSSDAGGGSVVSGPGM